MLKVKAIILKPSQSNSLELNSFGIYENTKSKCDSLRSLW